MSEQVGLGIIPGISIVAAFGLITMSSTIANNSTTSMTIRPDYYYEASGYFHDIETFCNSSMLSKQTVGDIVLSNSSSDFVQKHEKMTVILQISKIKRHISHFEFEDEYEEI